MKINRSVFLFPFFILGLITLKASAGDCPEETPTWQCVLDGRVRCQDSDHSSQKLGICAGFRAAPRGCSAVLKEAQTENDPKRKERRMFAFAACACKRGLTEPKVQDKVLDESLRKFSKACREKTAEEGTSHANQAAHTDCTPQEHLHSTKIRSHHFLDLVKRIRDKHPKAFKEAPDWESFLENERLCKDSSNASQGVCLGFQVAKSEPSCGRLLANIRKGNDTHGYDPAPDTYAFAACMCKKGMRAESFKDVALDLDVEAFSSRCAEQNGFAQERKDIASSDAESLLAFKTGKEKCNLKEKGWECLAEGKVNCKTPGTSKELQGICYGLKSLKKLGRCEELAALVEADRSNERAAWANATCACRGVEESAAVEVNAAGRLKDFASRCFASNKRPVKDAEETTAVQNTVSEPAQITAQGQVSQVSPDKKQSAGLKAKVTQYFQEKKARRELTNFNTAARKKYELKLQLEDHEVTCSAVEKTKDPDTFRCFRQGSKNPFEEVRVSRIRSVQHQKLQR